MNGLRAPLLACLLAAAPCVVLAQWQWIDLSGRKVYSDQAPPPEIPAKNIVKQPGPRMAPASDAAAPGAAASAAGAASAPARPAPPPGTAAGVPSRDRELLDRKRQTETHEADKRKAEEERFAKLKQDNCARVRQGKAAMDSGRRISRTNEKGEVEFLDDAQRAAESQRLQTILDTDCK